MPCPCLRLPRGRSVRAGARSPAGTRETARCTLHRELRAFKEALVGRQCLHFGLEERFWDRRGDFPHGGGAAPFRRRPCRAKDPGGAVVCSGGKRGGDRETLG